MIADRYLEHWFREGFEVGWQEGIELGREEGREEVRQEGREKSRRHIKEVLEQAGIELPPEVKAQLFGDSDREAGDE